MAIIRIKAIVVGDENTTFYREDGQTFDLPTSDPRMGKIIEEATPSIAAGQVALVDFESVQTTHYKQFEEKTNGLVKLFRVAKKFVSHIFHDPHDPENQKPEPQVIGIVPGSQTEEVQQQLEQALNEPQPEVQAKTDKLTNAASEIISKAQSVNDPKFTDDETKDDDTIIAVVEDEKGEQVIIPGMENLKDHMALALKLGSTTGVQNFLTRISKVIGKRGHSIDDLLRFMSRNDMPIADDGCLVAFKTLNRRGNHRDVYQDIHSGNVIQRVGSKVFMAESMVDPNRRNECSNGLHVARRAYVGGFRGSHGVMCLIKVAPEDVIAVPSYDANKMRVCGYHIVADVPSEDHGKVYSNQPIPKDSPTAKVLGAVIKGHHIGIIEHVEIGGARGGNLRVTKVGSEADNNRQLKEARDESRKAEPVASLDDKKDGANASGVDTKAVAAKVAETKAAAAPSKSAQARVLFDAKKFPELIAFKKAAKKGWSALGFNATEEAMILNAKTGTTPPASPSEPAKAEDIPHVPNKKTVKALKEAEALATETKEPKMEGTRAEVARTLFDQAAAGDKTRWGSLWRHQKECKKSWKVLGFSDKEIERIKTNKPDWV